MYTVMRWLVGLALGFYFRRIERFHVERVPEGGPVLFASNHPNSLADSFVIGASVPRKVNFVATVQLFRIAPLRWMLSRCGVIPINRVKDNPRAMRSVSDTFEACYRVLEAGEAIGIFPEGITYDDEQLKEVKSGAARMALEIEHRHGARLGLRIVPVGLTYSAKDIYRSDVLAHFGEPIRAADFLDGYPERRKERIHKLTAEIENRLKSLILHLPQLEEARLVAAVGRLYSDEVREERRLAKLAPGAEELVVAQRMAQVVEHMSATAPERVAAFAAKLSLYEHSLSRLRLHEENLALFAEKGKLAQRSMGWALLILLGAPVALYGWIHRAIPYAVVKWAAGRFSEPGKRKAQAATSAIVAGTIAFGSFYGLCILLFHTLAGWPASFWYALSLPPASLLAHYYTRELRRLIGVVQSGVLLLRAPFAARRLMAMRAELRSEIEAARQELVRSVDLTGSQRG
jgi:1-acyl-sn-glycerol-3-phosphate acyltransferase